jgi:cytochrome c oxidase accessory protein FixG
MNTPAPPDWQPARSTTQESVEAALYEVRRKIYPRAVSGRFASWRVWTVLLTQLLFYGLAWVQWNGRQAVLFDLAARKFHIFGLVLWPQDIIFLTVLLVISALSLFLFTALAGRLFCGYACPQTVYTEIFMWIERKIEGDRFARIRLDSDPWSFRKFRLKALKHVAWGVIALWTGLTFVGYFTPIRELVAAVANFSLGPWEAFWMLFYSFATWGNAGFLREQVCKYMCPYARFQSVMVDHDTLVVTYDTVRGDPRGKRSKREDHRQAGLGDCVDCSICVQVCPTGIDIRDGLQYECIGCGACIDACNQVMDKMSYPQGLIRYTSERAIEERLSSAQTRRYFWRPRVLIYTALLVVLIGAFFSALAMRTPLKVDVMRDRGVLAREVEGGVIENVYRLQLINTSEVPLHLSISAEGLPGLGLKGVGPEASGEVVVAAASNQLVPVRLQLPIDTAEPGTHAIRFRVIATTPDSDIDVREASSFIVPK